MEVIAENSIDTPTIKTKSKSKQKMCAKVLDIKPQIVESSRYFEDPTLTVLRPPFTNSRQCFDAVRRENQASVVNPEELSSSESVY